MSENTALQVFSNVAHNLRQARLRQGLSQEKLAASAGVSRRMLINIETGASNVSLATLDRLAAALGLSFAEVVRAAGEQGPVRVWQGHDDASHATLLQSLQLEQTIMELWRWQLQPGAHYQAEPDPAGSAEVLLVIAGELTLQLDGQSHRLQCGQSISYGSDTRYAYHNHGDVLLQFTRNVLLPAPRALRP